MKKIAERFGYFGTAISTGLLAFALTGTAWAQDPQPEPAPPAQEEPAPEEEVQELQTFEGTLIEVNAEDQSLTVQSAEGEEKQFSYNDETQVIGAEGSIQGLSAQAGTQVSVEYENGWTGDTAKTIEVIGAETMEEPAPEPGSEPSPSPEPEPSPRR